MCWRGDRAAVFGMQGKDVDPGTAAGQTGHMMCSNAKSVPAGAGLAVRAAAAAGPALAAAAVWLAPMPGQHKVSCHRLARLPPPPPLTSTHLPTTKTTRQPPTSTTTNTHTHTKHHHGLALPPPDRWMMATCARRSGQTFPSFRSSTRPAPPVWPMCVAAACRKVGLPSGSWAGIGRASARERERECTPRAWQRGCAPGTLPGQQGRRRPCRPR